MLVKMQREKRMKAGILLIRNSLYQHILFWVLVMAYSSAMLWQVKRDVFIIIRSITFEIPLQAGIAYSVLYFFIPKFLNRNKYFLFFFSLAIIVCICHICFSLYLDIQIAESENSDYSFFKERISNIYRYIRAFVSYLTPTVFLLMLEYYKKQKKIAILLEQKKTDELKALKNQLNPHFLFNTLNTLYTLALKKSDKTAEIISKLSEILDYTLYGCKETYVDLQDEINLLENYISLQQIRYSKRVKVIFTKNCGHRTKIAPLLLLTFLENAFKHGVREEINTAKIDIRLYGDNHKIDFRIRNTKPQINSTVSDFKKSLGLKNLRTQLELLYPKNYELNIQSTKTEYVVTLKITSNVI